MKKKLIALLLLGALMLGTAVSCDIATPTPTPRSKQYYEYFNTVSVITSYLGDTEDEFTDNCNVVDSILSEYHRLFDIYYEYSGINNLKTVNKNAGVSPVEVSPKLIDFLLWAKEMYTLTGGEVNIALGSVLSLWHDAREAASVSPNLARIPSMDELTEAMEHTSIDGLIIDEENCTVYLSDSEMSLDVGALGKGYAAEAARRALIDMGVSSYVLNIGGNISAIGTKPDGNAWRTSVKSPHEAGKYALTVNLKDTSCVTSGDYERYFIYENKKYHHIIDKDTLMPSEYFSSITVITPDSALADALSTALFSMSYEDGLSLVKGIEGVDVYWISTDGDEYMTDGIREIISG